MARYFKITEIDCDSFFQCTGEELDCSQLVVPVIGYVFVAVDDTDEDVERIADMTMKQINVITVMHQILSIIFPPPTWLL